MAEESRSFEQLQVLYGITNAVTSTLELDEVLDIILSDTLKIFAAEAGSIMLLEGAEMRILKAKGLPQEIIDNTVVRLGEGIAGYVAKTGEPLLLNGKVDDSDGKFKGVVNRKDDITSSLCAPLLTRNGVIGVMMLRRSGPKPFTQDNQHFFCSVVSQAAIAIENARLFLSEQVAGKKLEIERSKLESIFKYMADGVVVLDNEGCIVLLNQPAKNFLSLDGSSLGVSFGKLFPVFSLERIKAFLNEKRLSYEFELTVPKHNENFVFRVSVTSWNNEADSLDSFVLLLHDITERVQVERMKTEFLSAVSHELKTPLTTVIGFVQLLSEKDCDREKQIHYLDICMKESERLRRLIEDLLVLSKLESGRFQLSTQYSDISQMITSTVANYAERYPNFNFTCDIKQHPIMLNMDDLLLNQVLSNLLSNAVKYSPNGGNLDVKVEVLKDKVVVSVKDQGVGIPFEKIPFVFDKFYRVDNSLTRRTSGTGLGLTNARHIVEKHGGSIWVESEEGKGSKFLFELPLNANEEQKNNLFEKDDVKSSLRAVSSIIS